jgi:hypothetical protein
VRELWWRAAGSDLVRRLGKVGYIAKGLVIADAALLIAAGLGINTCGLYSFAMARYTKM